MDRKPLHPKSSVLAVGEWAIEKPAAKKRKACRVCQKEGHEPGSSDCKHFEQPSETVVAFQGKKTILFPTFTPVKSKPLAKFTNLLNMHISLQKQ